MFWMTMIWVATIHRMHDMRLPSRSNCQFACTRNRGVWNSVTSLCRVELHANEICIRVRESDGTWIVDDDK